MSISKELTEALDHLQHAAMGYAQDPNMHTSRRLTEAREAVMLNLHPSTLITSKQDLEQVELYRLQLAGIMSAAIGYWNEGDRIQPDYDTVALRDVAKLHTKYVEAVQGKDGAYEERNRLVALLCTLLPAVRCKTVIEGWSEDWHGCVYLTLPNGQQASWHYHDSQAELFAHVPEGVATWDGHTTPEKYQRIAACCAEPQGQLTQDDIIELARRFDVYLGSPEDKLLAYSRHLLSLPRTGVSGWALTDAQRQLVSFSLRMVAADSRSRAHYCAQRGPAEHVKPLLDDAKQLEGIAATLDDGVTPCPEGGKPC